MNLKKDYPGKMTEHKCRICGKKFLKVDPPNHAYTIRWKNRHYNTCSYKCFCEQRRRLAELDRDKKLKITGAGVNCSEMLYTRLGVERGESHTLGEWADILGCDIVRLWSIVCEMQMNIIDAIDIIQSERRDA